MSRCSKPCWRTPSASATPNSAISIARDGDAFRPRGDATDTPPAFAESRKRSPFQSQLRISITCVSRPKRRFTSSDLAADERYVEQRDPITVAAVEAWRYKDVGRRSDAKRKRTDRCDLGLPPRSSSLHRQADRAGAEFRRTGRHRHREHAAARTNCANRCSSRPPPPTCSKSSAARHSICRRCWIR